MAALIVEKGVSVVLLNKISIRSVGALGSLLVFATASQAAPLPPQKASPEAQAMEQGRKLLASRSARFVENKGQWKQEARFLVQGRSLDLWYTDHGIRYDQRSGNNKRHQTVDMVFVGGAGARPVGVSKINAEMQVYHNDLKVKGIRSYHEVLSKNVIPGVDMRGYFDKGMPRYDLIVAPGTKPSSVAMSFRGSNGLALSKGALKIGTNLGGIYNGKPVAYQIVDGKRIAVAAAWTVDDNTARFKLGAYDVRRPLVIDPLVYGTYFGGEQGPEEIRAAAIDTVGGGGLFIVGSSASPDFPATTRPFTDTLNPEGIDAFVARITTAGTATDFSVLIGGQGTDIAQFLKINPRNGDLWFAGTTISGTTQTNGSFNTFPSTLTAAGGARRVVGADQASRSNFFVARFTHTPGTALNFGDDPTAGVTFPTTPRIATVFGSGVANALTRSAYITGFDINPLANGTVQMAFSGVTDTALSTALITTPAGATSASQTYGYTFPNHRAGFLLRFDVDPTGGRAAANAFQVNSFSSQYVTGTRRSELRGVALDAAGNAYVAGSVYQPDQPTTADPLNVDTAQQPQFFYTTSNTISNANGTTVLGRILRATDVFVRIYGLYGTQVGQSNISYSALIGGNGNDEAGGVACSLSVDTTQGTAAPVYTGSAIAIDADTNIYVTGTTRAAANFPHTAGSYGGFTPPTNGDALAASDIFAIRLSSGGSRLDYAATLGVHARALPISYDPASFTSAMPAGIAVDSRGYVYITGNLRPYSIVFPSTYTAPAVFEPSSSTISTIPTTADALDATYSLPTAGPFPSTEGFLCVLNPTFTTLQYGTYVGGSLDDLVFAPSNFDASGNIILTGWTDGERVYNPPYRGPIGMQAPYDGFSGLPGFISSNAVKTNSDSAAAFLVGTFGYSVWGTDSSNPGSPDQFFFNPNSAGQSFMVTARDGFVAQVGVGLPNSVNPTIALTFLPTSIPALGTSVGTVTLNAAQPLKTVVTITGPTLVGLSASDIAISGLTATGTANTYTLTIPSGQTSASFTVKSVTVANGGGASFTATIPSGSSTSTSTSGITIGGLSFSMTLTPSVVVGSSAGTTVTGTLALPGASTDPTVSSTAPTTLNFIVTVPNTPANRTIFNVGTSSPFATVDPSDATKLDLTTATIAAGASRGTFTFKVGSPTAPTALIVTASTVASSTVGTLTATASLTVNPVGLVSITPKQSALRGGRDQLVLTVVFDGPVSSADPFSLSYSLGGVFPPTTSSSPTLNTTIGALAFQSVNSSGQYIYTYTANSNRVTRSQDIQILATYKGTTASTSVTVVR